jgi:hypothetical protein
MKQQLTIDLDEAIRVFRLLEKMNQLFHQPMAYKDEVLLEKFATENYPEIRTLYYNTVWDWLPENTQQEIEG